MSATFRPQYNVPIRVSCVHCMIPLTLRQLERHQCPVVRDQLELIDERMLINAY